jgi:ABC-2 type transport system permease protein
MNAKAKYIAFQTILVKEILRFIRIWMQTILPPMITTALYFIIFGNLIGSQIGDMEGYRYMDYIVPGLILMAIITNSYSNVVSSFYSSKYQSHIQEMIIAPLPNYIILIGFVAGGTARGLIVGLAVTVVALFFSDINVAHYGITLAIALFTAILFSIAGLLNGIYANSFDDISIIPTFVLTPLTYLGGIFYSISMLPEFWQTVSLANPILYMVNGFRYGILGSSDISPVASFSLIGIFIIGLYLFALYLLNKGHGIRS